MKQRSSKYRHVAKAFLKVKSKHRMTVFMNMTHFPPTREEADHFVEQCARAGVVCVIPRLPTDSVPSAQLFWQIKAMYTTLLASVRRFHIKLGLHLDPLLEQCYYMTLPEHVAETTRSRSLIRREYYCDPCEHLDMDLHGGTLMSLVAYDDEHMDTIDLAPYVKDGHLDYTVPSGNWTVEEYICTSEPLRGETLRLSCNRLSITDSLSCLQGLLDALDLAMQGEPGNYIHTLYASELCFDAPNRRNWDPAFNQFFQSRFGFDPAPYYPVLYHSTTEQGMHIKALMMDNRAEMLRAGFLCALKTITDRNDMRLIVSGAEVQLPACSWLCGDALANQVFSPCAVQEKSYLYGMNSTHLAASAADNFGSKFVACELFRDYSRLTVDIVRKDTLNAFGHGANMMLAHIDVTDTFFRKSMAKRLQLRMKGNRGNRSYPEFVARIQTLLRGGSRINDMAMLYPIYDLHSKVYLYESPVNQLFEYPNTPYTCNYMTVLNSISTYAGQDITLLHPRMLAENCHVEDGVITLTTPYQTQEFRILILPGMDMVSLASLRMVEIFYDQGGKVLAAGTLPYYAFEYDARNLHATEDACDFMHTEAYGTPEDVEVRRIVRHIFGDEALSPAIIRDSFYHANDKGGEAFFIASNQTGADGTEMTDAASLHTAIQSFHVPLDVYMPHMPRFECNGAFNTTYSDFARLGLVDYIPGGGMISHIHKRRVTDDTVDLDIFFFANTTDRMYDECIYLRGIYAPSRWDPHTGRTRRLHAKFVRIRGDIYTRVRLTLPQNHAAFLVSDPHPQTAKISALPFLPEITLFGMERNMGESEESREAGICPEKR